MNSKDKKHRNKLRVTNKSIIPIGILNKKLNLIIHLGAFSALLKAFSND